MRFLKFLKIAWRLSGNIPWVGEPEWETAEANALRRFLVTKEGKKLRMVMLNMVLKQNQQAVTTKKNLEFEAGVMGQRDDGIVIYHPIIQAMMTPLPVSPRDNESEVSNVVALLANIRGAA